MSFFFNESEEDDNHFNKLMTRRITMRRVRTISALPVITTRIKKVRMMLRTMMTKWNMITKVILQRKEEQWR
jgi:hypothetical protein